MRPRQTKRMGYTRAEYISDVVVHMLGLFTVVAGVPALIVAASLTSETAAPVAASVLYGISFAAMIVASAAYNVFPHPNWEWLLKRLDHSAIYVKIAGTVSAFALLAGKGLLLASGLLAVALVGIALKLRCPFSFRRLSLVLYLGMGWAVAVWGWGVFAALPVGAVVLICIGGALYTLGVVFYLWERLPYHNTIWHVFVLVSSILMYSATLVAVVA